MKINPRIYAEREMERTGTREDEMRWDRIGY